MNGPLNENVIRSVTDSDPSRSSVASTWACGRVKTLPDCAAAGPAAASDSASSSAARERRRRGARHQKRTCGAAAASGAASSKYGRSSKLNMPATMLVGTVSIAVS